MQGFNWFSFRDWQSVGPGNIGRFNIQNANPKYPGFGISATLRNPKPWWPKTQPTSFNLPTHVAHCMSTLLFYTGCPNSSHTAIGKIAATQSLHNSTVKDFLIIVHPLLLAEAQRLKLRLSYPTRIICVL
jgi:hypothetical protein